MRVRRAYEINERLLIVSKTHVSIENIVKNVFPETFHTLCYYHLLEIKHYDEYVANMYHITTYAYELEEYNKVVSVIESMSLSSYQKLLKVGPNR